MRQKTACFVSVVAAVLVSGGVLSSQALPAPVLADDPAIRASLARIATGSALWRAAVDAVRPTGRSVLVLTPEEVIVADPHSPDLRQFDRRQLADVAIIPGEGTEVTAVLVVVNVDLLRRMHARRGVSAAQQDADLDRILIHEVYGHAFPYLLAGDLSGRCADPTRYQRPTDACSIQRENAVRAELDLGRRVDYGLAGLALTRNGFWSGIHDR